MEMHQVRYFLAAADSLNFTRAAAVCNVSQPALTLAIKKLEEELGSPLFYREGKRLLLSEFGELMRPQLQQLQDQAESAQSVAASFRLLHKAPLRIGVLPTIGPLRLSRFLAAFQADYPGIEVTVEESALAGLCQRLADGKLDIAVLSSPASLGDDFRTAQLYSERYVVALPPEHRLQHCNAIKLAELTGEAYVDRLSCEFREMVMAVCSERKVELYARFRSEREDWVQGMVLGNLGFAFMPEYSITIAGLVVRPLVEPVVERHVMAVTVPGRPHSPAREAFLRALKAHKWP
jgi:DNA-binding transcriptional LysR family regulator